MFSTIHCSGSRSHRTDPPTALLFLLSPLSSFASPLFSPPLSSLLSALSSLLHHTFFFQHVFVEDTHCSRLVKARTEETTDRKKTFTRLTNTGDLLCFLLSTAVDDDDNSDNDDNHLFCSQECRRLMRSASRVHDASSRLINTALLLRCHP